MVVIDVYQVSNVDKISIQKFVLNANFVKVLLVKRLLTIHSINEIVQYYYDFVNYSFI